MFVTKLLALVWVSGFTTAVSTSFNTNSSIILNTTDASDRKDINCKGSVFCSPFWFPPFKMNDIELALKEVSDEREFHEGEQINTHGQTLSGALAKKKIQKLIDHHCRFCGRVALEEGGSFIDGMLKIDYVSRACYIGGNRSLGPCLTLEDVQGKRNHTVTVTTTLVWTSQTGDALTPTENRYQIPLETSSDILGIPFNFHSSYMRHDLDADVTADLAEDFYV
ncbi:hypothetical protein DM02DRAFT_682402 [Periconia macrospinosa]|uniref:Killer toxin Kp4 domain-containing protein n=1 Tax=Periconia macrospinosa TaxID=97972 RepID=A0A2V1DMK1_9PLEO|nr:hypothetical protein DM02DRAFT_682402 [Periconia macrospinosa]